MATIKISAREKLCLEVLAKYYIENEDAQFVFFRTIAKKTGLPEDKVRCAVRSLSRKGLAEFSTGLMDGDGFICGSGYAATQSGVMITDYYAKYKQN